MRVALIGCGGFIGSHLLEALLPNPEYTVVGFDTDAAKIGHLLHHPRFTFHLGDAYLSGMLEPEIAAADVVVGLAAMCNPSQYNVRGVDVIESNFIQPRLIADLCARLGKWLIQFSTSEVYGQTLAHRAGLAKPEARHTVLSEDTSPLLMGPTHEQRWSYACAKQLLERYVMALHRERGLAYTLIRPFNFLGTRMDYLPGHDGEGVPRVLACFTGALIDKRPLTLVDGGHARRTFLAIEEAVDALVAMLRKPERAHNRIFNLGHPGNEVTIRALAETMRAIAAELTGDTAYLDLPLVDVPALEFYGEGYADSDRRMPDISKARQCLAWEPKRQLTDILRPILAEAFATYGKSQAHGTTSKATSHA
jgi:UDP-apiose/xylose synthase